MPKDQVALRKKTTLDWKRGRSIRHSYDDLAEVIKDTKRDLDLIEVPVDVLLHVKLGKYFLII